MLKELLNSPTDNQDHQKPFYSYLPVSTSLHHQIRKLADNVKGGIQTSTNNAKWNQFNSNEDSINIQNQLILLKLKGYINQKDITGKSTEVKKLPKVQVGTIIEGDPLVNLKISKQKKQHNIVDYFLNQDQQANFTHKKFTEIQKIKQRHKKIKKIHLIKNKKGKKLN